MKKGTSEKHEDKEEDNMCLEECGGRLVRRSTRTKEDEEEEEEGRGCWEMEDK